MVSAHDRDMALRITPHLHEAVADPALWQKTLGLFAGAFDASAGKFSLVRPSNLDVVFSVSTSDRFKQNLCWLASDTNSKSVLRNDCPNGADASMHTCKCRMIILGKKTASSGIYRQVLKPCGFQNVMAMPVWFQADDLLAILGLFRDSSRDPFSSHDSRKLQLYYPHFCSAMSSLKLNLETRISVARQKALVDQMYPGLLVCDHTGNIVEHNSSAALILDRADGLMRSESNRIGAIDPEAANILTQSIYKMTIRKSRSGSCEPAFFSVVRHSGKCPYFVTVRSLKSPGCGSAKLAIVNIVDPDAQSKTDSDRLKRMFGLTAAEAEVLVQISRGHSPQEIAKRTGRAYQTIRNQLQSVRNKTGIRRQADLIRLTLNSSFGFQDIVADIQ